MPGDAHQLPALTPVTARPLLQRATVQFVSSLESKTSACAHRLPGVDRRCNTLALATRSRAPQDTPPAPPNSEPRPAAAAGDGAAASEGLGALLLQAAAGLLPVPSLPS